MHRIGMFFSLSCLSYRGLFLWLTPWAFISAVILGPFLNYLLFAFVAFNGAPAPVLRDVLLNFPVISVAAAVLGGILQMFYYERIYDLLKVPQGPAVRALFAKAVLHIPNGVLAFIGPFFLSLYWLDIPLSGIDWPILLLSILVICVGYASFSILLGVLVSATGEWLTPHALGVAIFYLLSGALIPLDAFPKSLQLLATGLPVTHGLIAYKLSVLSVAQPGAIREIGTEFVISIFYSVLACCAWTVLSSLRRTGRA